MLTADATWSRPIRIAERNRARAPSCGLARRSSHTALVWVTVTSSSTPSAPMTMPASRRPRASTPEPSEATSAVAWSSSPVSRAAAVNPAPRAPISASDTSVPSTAVDVRADNPCVRYSTANMITPEPTTATASGLRPSRIAGRTNSSSTAKLTTSAPRAASPRHRPRTSTAAEKSTASQASDPPRWKSTIWYEPGSSGSPPDQPSTTGSPTVNRGVPGSRGTIWTRSRPARGPSDMATTSAAQRPCPSPGEQSVVCTAVTCPRTGCCSGAPAGVAGPPVGRRTTSPTRAASAQGTSSTARSTRTRWPAGAAGPWPWPCPCSRRVVPGGLAPVAVLVSWRVVVPSGLARGVRLVAGPVRRDDGKGLGRGLRRGPATARA